MLEEHDVVHNNTSANLPGVLGRAGKQAERGERGKAPYSPFSLFHSGPSFDSLWVGLFSLLWFHADAIAASVYSQRGFLPPARPPAQAYP